MSESLSNQSKCEMALGCWYVSGATAGGKTDVGVQLAKRIGGEVISLDSMAIYREMDIGTAKPSMDQRESVPHHLIDIADPVESFSVTQYRDAAMQKIAEIQERECEVIFVGGSALYLKAMLRGIFEGPPADWEFRKSIESELESVGIEQLHRRLAQVDPLSAEKLHPNDKRRIIRALEVYTTTGTPISHLQNEFEFSTPGDQCRVFTLRHPREQLHQRIEDRVAEMFDSGFVDEVRGLLDRWDSLSHTAEQAVGYKEVIDFVKNGGELDKTREQVLFRTRRFARHQETWFRGLKECRILDIDTDTPIDSTVDQLLELANSKNEKPKA